MGAAASKRSKLDKRVAVLVLNKIAPSVFKILVSLKNVCRIGIARWNKFMSALGKIFSVQLGWL